MPKSRLELHEVLVGILGSRNVYFQPPESLKLQYPCIVYERSKVDKVHADDESYLLHKAYTVTTVDEDPDSEIPDKVLALPHCRHERHYVSDNLNHEVFEVYY